MPADFFPSTKQTPLIGLSGRLGASLRWIDLSFAKASGSVGIFTRSSSGVAELPPNTMPVFRPACCASISDTSIAAPIARREAVKYMRLAQEEGIENNRIARRDQMKLAIKRALIKAIPNKASVNRGTRGIVPKNCYTFVPRLFRRESAARPCAPRRARAGGLRKPSRGEHNCPNTTGAAEVWCRIRR